MRLNSDVDIDLANRDMLLQHIKHIPASMRRVNPIRKHATGVHITEIPWDPAMGMAAIDYSEAEARGYFKLDLLNVHVYNHVRDEKHLIECMREPNWSKLQDRSFVEKLIHIGNHYGILSSMPEPVNSIPRLSMFLAVIRPAKRHLIGLPWAEIAKTVWDKTSDGYQFKKSHSCAYAHLVVIHMNILEEQENGLKNESTTS